MHCRALQPRWHEALEALDEEHRGRVSRCEHLHAGAPGVHIASCQEFADGIPQIRIGDALVSAVGIALKYSLAASDGTPQDT